IELVSTPVSLAVCSAYLIRLSLTCAVDSPNKPIDLLICSIRALAVAAASPATIASLPNLTAKAVAATAAAAKATAAFLPKSATLS
ncbi:hypothetical protein, partial [Shewanella sp.]|uniref:hypothetical protein n=1 Tax=Shewanella sp. TaxID=50422 RepID=UPI004048D40E